MCEHLLDQITITNEILQMLKRIREKGYLFVVGWVL